MRNFAAVLQTLQGLGVAHSAVTKRRILQGLRVAQAAVTERWP